MVRELERLLSSCYAPHDNVYFSAIAKMKDGMVFGGVLVKNDIFRSTIYAEEAAIANAVSHGYKKSDFDSLYVMTSSKNLNDLKNINKNMISEFYENDAEIFLYDINRNERIIKVGNLIDNIY